MAAKFIVLDGIDGAGKTTQLNVVREWFAARGKQALFTREPGGTPLGEQLRALLLAPETQISLEAETLLMFAARSQHLHDVIRPALLRGENVVSDRFTDATFAYQGGGRGVSWQALAQLDRDMRHGPREFSWFIYRMPTPAMRDLFMGPRNTFRVKEAIISLLAGDIYGQTPIWRSLRVFKAIYYLTSLAQLPTSLRSWRWRKQAIRTVDEAPQG